MRGSLPNQFCGSGQGIRRHSGVLWNYGVLGPVMRAVREQSQFAVKCEAARMRISSSKSEALLRWSVFLGSGRRSWPYYLASLFTSEGKMKQEITRGIGATSAVMWTRHRSIMVIYLSLFCSYSHLWSQALDIDRKNKIAGTSGLNELFLQGVSATQKELDVEPLL